MLQDRLGELQATITFKKEAFVQDMFSNENAEYLDAMYSTSSIDGVPPPQAPTETDDWEMRVANAYDTFQRIALVLEVVKADLEFHGDGTERVKQLWRMLEGQVEGVLVNLFIELEMRGMNEPTLSMAVLPPSLRCEQSRQEKSSLTKNRRDFVVLRHVLHAASIFSDALNQL